MPESLLDRRLKLGRFLGIGLYVHWSFSLVVLFVAISALETGVAGVAFAITQLLGVFLCVTLHEYGHAMAARQFGIGTADITLLPIGGVARLQRMPRIPWQELIVALAGPAVNVVIVGLLLITLFLTDATLLYALAGYLVSLISGAPLDEAMADTMVATFVAPSITGFAVTMLVVNTMLVLFNLIPAFPMDGGRVFRSLLAMMIEYRKATMIAARIGLGCAVLMAMVALTTNPLALLIAAFIGYAGMTEARQVEVMESVRGLTAGGVMVHSLLSIDQQMPLTEVAQKWSGISQEALAVVDGERRVLGTLSLRAVAEHLSSDPATMLTAGDLVRETADFAVVRFDEELDSALLRTGKQQRYLPVVDSERRLVGILDLESVLARGELAKHSPPQHFDQTS